MAHLLVTGSIGIDSVDAPTGSRRDCLGGAATYFALAAGKLCSVRLVGVVGDDFPAEFVEILTSGRIDITGLEIRSGSKTFRWHGRYSQDMNSRVTLDVQLNVLAEQGPTIPKAFRNSEYVFLANNDPALQLEFLDQLKRPKLVVCDTMDLWIEHHRNNLLKVLGRVDGLVINDSEARHLSGKDNLLTAAKCISQLGPRYVVIKKGEHGVILYADYADYADQDVLVLPAYLTETVVDPTGAGDSFAGGLMGYLTQQEASRDDLAAWRAGLVHATVLASHTVERFSVDGLVGLDDEKLKCRLDAYRKMIQP